LRAHEVGNDTRAAALLARCEGARTPLARPAPAAGGGPELTKREREISELAANGASNAEIAARLAISVRTVESHLQHVYDKLGVGSRAELATALGR
jgi:DNA-binding CsgD family transcriptional regulator